MRSLAFALLVAALPCNSVFGQVSSSQSANPDPRYIDLDQHLPELASGHIRHGFEFPRRFRTGRLVVELISGKNGKIGFDSSVVGGGFTKTDIKSPESGRRDRRVLFEYYTVGAVDVEDGESFDFPSRDGFHEANAIWLHSGRSLPQGGRNFAKVIVDAPSDVAIQFRIWERRSELERRIQSIQSDGETKAVTFGGKRARVEVQVGEQ